METNYIYICFLPFRFLKCIFYGIGELSFDINLLIDANIKD